MAMGRNRYDTELIRNWKRKTQSDSHRHTYTKRHRHDKKTAIAIGNQIAIAIQTYIETYIETLLLFMFYGTSQMFFVVCFWGILMFDFNILRRQIVSQYRHASCDFSLDEVIDIFRMFIETYHDVFGIDHPYMSNNTVRKVIDVLDDFNNYDELIPLYFDQDFGSTCNYSMAHFCSGDVRYYRWLESTHEEPEQPPTTGKYFQWQ